MSGYVCKVKCVCGFINTGLTDDRVLNAVLVCVLDKFFDVYERRAKMEYKKPEVEKVSLEVKGIERESGNDGPSRCSNSCCFYRDGATW